MGRKEIVFKGKEGLEVHIKESNGGEGIIIDVWKIRTIENSVEHKLVDTFTYWYDDFKSIPQRVE